MPKRIFLRHRRSWVAGFGALCTGIALAAAIHSLREHELGRLNVQSARSTALHARSDPAEASLLQSAEGTYRELAERGAVGPEQRRRWLLLIEELADAHGLAGLAYDLAPQQPAFPHLNALQGPEFRSSAMTLRMDVAHELSLLDFLDDLGTRAPALIRVGRCAMERLETEKLAAPHLRVDCTLDWVTLRVGS